MGQGNLLDQREDQHSQVGFWRLPNVNRDAAIPNALSRRSSVWEGRAACVGGIALRGPRGTAVQLHVSALHLGTLAGAPTSKVR